MLDGMQGGMDCGQSQDRVSGGTGGSRPGTRV